MTTSNSKESTKQKKAFLKKAEFYLNSGILNQKRT